MRKAIVIGGGPAGLTAGIYLGRANLEPLLLTGAMPGGQLTTTTDIENFPGFAKGLPGPKLMEEMEEQARNSGAEIEYDEATGINCSGSELAVCVGSKELEAHAIIIASGASPRTLGLPSEKTFWSAGVHTCAVCDGGFYRGKEVVVIGGGDSAMEEASYLAKLCKQVTVIHRRDQLRASAVMQERVLENPKIEILWDTIVEEFLGEVDDPRRRLTGARLKNLKTEEIHDFKADAAFLAIGHIPNTEYIKDAVELYPDGYVKVDEHLRTSHEAIWAAGDVHDRRYRQAITAAAYGCQAAMEVERYLTEKGLA